MILLILVDWSLIFHLVWYFDYYHHHQLVSNCEMRYRFTIWDVRNFASRNIILFANLRFFIGVFSMSGCGQSWILFRYLSVDFCLLCLDSSREMCCEDVQYIWVFTGEFFWSCGFPVLLSYDRVSRITCYDDSTSESHDDIPIELLFSPTWRSPHGKSRLLEIL